MPAQRAARVAYEVNPVGDIKETIDHPIAAHSAAQRCVPWTGQSKACSGSNAQQIEIRIARRELSLKLLHSRIKTLHRISRIMRSHRCHAGHVRNG